MKVNFVLENFGFFKLNDVSACSFNSQRGTFKSLNEKWEGEESPLPPPDEYDIDLSFYEFLILSSAKSSDTYDCNWGRSNQR